MAYNSSRVTERELMIEINNNTEFGYIYFIRLVGGPVKIGYVADRCNIENKLHNIELTNPCPVILARQIHGLWQARNWLHARYEHLKIKNEWFSWRDEMAIVELPQPEICRLTRLERNVFECAVRDRQARALGLAARAPQRYLRMLRGQKVG